MRELILLGGWGQRGTSSLQFKTLEWRIRRGVQATGSLTAVVGELLEWITWREVDPVITHNTIGLWGKESGVSWSVVVGVVGKERVRNLIGEAKCMFETTEESLNRELFEMKDMKPEYKNILNGLEGWRVASAEGILDLLNDVVRARPSLLHRVWEALQLASQRVVSAHPAKAISWQNDNEELRRLVSIILPTPQPRRNAMIG